MSTGNCQEIAEVKVTLTSSKMTNGPFTPETVLYAEKERNRKPAC